MVPFFVLHGEADIVTNPEISRELYERASTGDKTLKLYQGMWHGLTSGEINDNVEIVFPQSLNIIDWLHKRSSDDKDLRTTDNPCPLHHLYRTTVMSSSATIRSKTAWPKLSCGKNLSIGFILLLKANMLTRLEEEVAAIEELMMSEPENSVPEMIEAHIFFPPGGSSCL